jgi:hypothetical protein
MVAKTIWEYLEFTGLRQRAFDATPHNANLPSQLALDSKQLVDSSLQDPKFGAASS